MIILDVPQGTTQWMVERLWRLTASEMKSNITATGELSKSKAAIKAIDKLIAGIDLANEMNRQSHLVDQMNDRELKDFMRHYTGDSFTGSLHTERGKDCEPEAIAAMSEMIGSQIMDVGMVVMGDNKNGVVSCSPDGFEWTGDVLEGGAEIKSPCLFNYYNQVAENELPEEYKIQVHAGMAICEVDVWHFGSYFPGKPLHYLKVQRSAFTDKLEKSLRAFEEMYRERYYVVMERMEKIAMGKEAA